MNETTPGSDIALVLVVVGAVLGFLLVFVLYPRHLQNQARRESKRVPDANERDHPYDSGPLT